jgi:hypothetical protein
LWLARIGSEFENDRHCASPKCHRRRRALRISNIQFEGELQVAKAVADLPRWYESESCVKMVADDLSRFPILGSHLYETVGQLQAMLNNPVWSKKSTELK